MLSHSYCFRDAFGVMYVVLCVHVGLRRAAVGNFSPLSLSCLLCLYPSCVVCMSVVWRVGVCLPICIVSAAHSASCMLCFVCMLSCRGLKLVSVPPSSCPVCFFGLFSFVYECGVVCRRKPFHVHCVRGAFGVM